MPDNCEDCPCGYETEGVYRDECQVLSREWEKDATSNRPDWCPLVEAPKGAKLIDANKIIKAMDNMQVEGEVFVTAVNYVKLIVNDAPAIFEEDDE